MGDSIGLLCIIIAMTFMSQSYEKENARLRQLLMERMSPEEIEKFNIKPEEKRPAILNYMIWGAIIIVPIIYIMFM